VITLPDALAGFNNAGIGTVAVTFMLAEGIHRTAMLTPLLRVLTCADRAPTWTCHRHFHEQVVYADEHCHYPRRHCHTHRLLDEPRRCWAR
jgi:hypothetical protein